jgi:hypothetical protein
MFNYSQEKLFLAKANPYPKALFYFLSQKAFYQHLCIQILDTINKGWRRGGMPCHK